MKKIMMLLMVSVFFLMGGMSDGIAENAKNVSNIQVVSSPPYMVAYPGQTVNIEYTISGLNSDSFWIYIYVQKPGKTPELLFILSSNGRIHFRNPAMSNRITVSYDSSRRRGVIRINWAQPEDTGVYYVAVGTGNQFYWSAGTMLIVDHGPFFKIKRFFEKSLLYTKQN
ncbi:immunoglobulin domain-containing protein [Gabonibacter chumensis]|uniref:immunoglobulin domain-containing protein n=1 Tax=Gabonibacter chumensis TaxID=2972474 RepID=UPI0025739F59|nr:immunoglobulin domain-containing protein [Gabonibacter chumensis]MCR9011014.1 immunoglobulin domain-containing protein [Gabonibacter chumensis]